MRCQAFSTRAEHGIARIADPDGPGSNGRRYLSLPLHPCAGTITALPWPGYPV